MRAELIRNHCVAFSLYGLAYRSMSSHRLIVVTRLILVIQSCSLLVKLSATFVVFYYRPHCALSLVATIFMANKDYKDLQIKV